VGEGLQVSWWKRSSTLLQNFKTMAATEDIEQIDGGMKTGLSIDKIE